jgi:hypothetical protein
MKKLKLFLLGIILLVAGSLNAQISINIGTPPQWGPAGYNDVEYYYLPDVHSYYDVRASRFIYYQGGVWVHRKSLPLKYRSYDLYDGYKVVLTDYHGKTPYIHYKDHKVKYAKGYNGGKQNTIGMKPGRGNNKAQVNSRPGSGNKSSGNSNQGKQGKSKGGNNRGKK